MFIAGPVVWVLMLLAGIPRAEGAPSLRLLLIVVLVSPVLEEIVFRGGLQAWLFDKSFFRHSIGAGVSVANLITSLIFAAFHAFSQPWIWAASIVLPSLVFGWARDRTGSIAPSIILHIWYNLGFVYLFVR